MDQYTAPTSFFDCDHPDIRACAEQHTSAGMSAKEKAIGLYHAVRDGIRYNPYRFGLEAEIFRASHCLQQGESFCIPKAVLLGALARCCGIPSRLGLADVRNHLASPELLKWMGTDVFAMHGYTELYLGDRWVKATPAFNHSLCEKMNLLPLEFDGESDSIFHAFSADGKQHMEYIRDYGTFADVPLSLIREVTEKTYPHLNLQFAAGRSLEKEV